MVHALL
jgi:hypothetical protein